MNILLSSISLVSTILFGSFIKCLITKTLRIMFVHFVSFVLSSLIATYHLLYKSPTQELAQKMP